MILEIRGAGFHNQGSALMLRAVVERFTGRTPEVALAVRPRGSYRARARLGLLQILPRRRRLVRILESVVLDPARRRQLGLVLEEELTGVLDASGLAYADAWGAGPARDLAARARDWKVRGLRVVLLPQAFGPFTVPGIREAVEEALGLVDLVFARDAASLHHLCELAGDSENIRLAPDFTLNEDPRPEDVARFEFAGVTVVPNERMLDKTDAAVAGGYADRLRSVVVELMADDVPVRLLAHGRGDRELADRIAQGSGLSLSVLSPDDPLEWKAALVGSRAVLGSRYHALVSALSHGVPAAALGWSHKYEELYREYGVPELCLPGDVTPAELVAVVRDLCTSTDVVRATRERLLAYAGHVREQVGAMWETVDHVLGTNAS